MAAVTDRQWQIFLLADVFGLRPREIHQRLGISERLYQLDHARALQAIGGRLGELLAGDWWSSITHCPRRMWRARPLQARHGRRD